MRQADQQLVSLRDKRLTTHQHNSQLRSELASLEGQVQRKLQVKSIMTRKGIKTFR